MLFYQLNQMLDHQISQSTKLKNPKETLTCRSSVYFQYNLWKKESHRESLLIFGKRVEYVLPADTVGQVNQVQVWKLTIQILNFNTNA